MNVSLGSKSNETNFIGDDKYRVVNINDRDIYFTGAINSDSMMDLIKELKHCEQKSLNALKIVKREITAAVGMVALVLLFSLNQPLILGAISRV